MKLFNIFLNESHSWEFAQEIELSAIKVSCTIIG